MARVDVSTSTDAEPSLAWKLASDLRLFDEWMTISSGGAARFRRRSKRAAVSRRWSGSRASATSFTGRSPLTTSRNQLSCRVAAGAGYGSRWQWT
jgi:hypothetical protein